MLLFNSRFLVVIWATIVSTVLVVSPVKAQLNLKQILETTPTSTLRFSPYTVGSVISSAGDRVYRLNAQKGQFLRLIVHSLGARAFVTVFAPNGQELTTLNGFDDQQEFEYQLTESGTYYIFCYSGPTFHFYDFTIRVD